MFIKSQEITSDEIKIFENSLRETVKLKLATLKIPKFDPSGLELARSEKEIAMCIKLQEQAKIKEEKPKREKKEFKRKKTPKDKLFQTIKPRKFQSKKSSGKRR